ncbi:unknown protein [Gluconacetobacter diazotrophicus PA1 5]|uniref:Uncharacterized protein n=1 Tax=Gluconacetobacter diazotrophicus (strain ATCC 49037 / DSM 5601 / CCUG 37298 / CIP 103539 / LMG 7603 / PAl5) TaxID=272568 RepID=A9H0V3_GLUDA|nr:unknown protein [Gluconacetobacter diazotrophicus PA1 5]
MAGADSPAVSMDCLIAGSMRTVQIHIPQCTIDDRALKRDLIISGARFKRNIRKGNVVYSHATHDGLDYGRY